MHGHLVRLIIVLFLSFLSGCAALPDNTHRSYTYAKTNTEDTFLGKRIIKESAIHSGQSGFVLLGNGLDAFVARAVLAEAAERSLDLQYYLYHNDLVGGLLGYYLLKAADRGVRVRVLLDDMGLEGRDVNIARLDSHPNIEIRIFNPFSRHYFRTLQFLTRFGDVTRRMHNKSFTVDNQVTIVGGRNIGNEYFNADPELAFGDLDVIAIGPVVKEVSNSFDKYWNSLLAYPITTLTQKETSVDELNTFRPKWEQFFSEQKQSEYYTALLNSDLARKIKESKEIVYNWGEAKALYDNPEKIVHDTGSKEFHLTPQLAPYFDNLNDELIILSAYFVPGKEGVHFLKTLQEKGVRVRILTNSLASTDVTLVHAGYAKYRRDLLRAGIELYEVNKKLTREQRKEQKDVGGSSKASLHAKAFIFDREKLFIGSLNLDPRSVHQNTEIGIIFNSPELGAVMGEWFDENTTSKTFRVELLKDEEDGMEFLRWATIENGETKYYTVDPYTSFWRRLLLGLAGLLPIESQL